MATKPPTRYCIRLGALNPFKCWITHHTEIIINPRDLATTEINIWGFPYTWSYPKWMVYEGKHGKTPLKWMMTGGTPMTQETSM